jgi:hypothetical protein
MESLPSRTLPWDIRILCDDAETGERARWLLKEISPSVGLGPDCEPQLLPLGTGHGQMLAMLGASLREAATADLVIVSTRGRNGLRPDDAPLLRHWVGECGGRLCPVLVLLDGEQGPAQFSTLATLEGLSAETRLPFFTNFSNALLEAWNNWSLKAKSQLISLVSSPAQNGDRASGNHKKLRSSSPDKLRMSTTRRRRTIKPRLTKGRIHRVSSRSGVH